MMKRIRKQNQNNLLIVKIKEILELDKLGKSKNRCKKVNAMQCLQQHQTFIKIAQLLFLLNKHQLEVIQNYLIKAKFLN